MQGKVPIPFQSNYLKVKVLPSRTQASPSVQCISHSGIAA